MIRLSYTFEISPRQIATITVRGDSRTLRASSYVKVHAPTSCKQNNLDVIISAAYIALRSIVLVELLGVQKLSNSFGILLLFQGIASIIGSPIAGKRFICRVVSNHKQHDNV